MAASRKFGIKAANNVVIGNGTLIKAPGYRSSIEATGNLQVADGKLIDTSPHRPRRNELATGKNIAVQVVGSVIASAVVGGAAYLWSIF
jgi:hypothetical protein